MCMCVCERVFMRWYLYRFACVIIFIYLCENVLVFVYIRLVLNVGL